MSYEAENVSLLTSIDIGRGGARVGVRCAGRIWVRGAGWRLQENRETGVLEPDLTTQPAPSVGEGDGTDSGCATLWQGFEIRSGGGEAQSADGALELLRLDDPARNIVPAVRGHKGRGAGGSGDSRGAERHTEPKDDEGTGAESASRGVRGSRLRRP